MLVYLFTQISTHLTIACCCRCGVKKLGDKDKKYVHMLNATLCATGRAICCLLETYQDVDGVHIPEVLVPYMGGITFLPFVRPSRAGDVQKPVAVVSGGSASAASTVPAIAIAGMKPVTAPSPSSARVAQKMEKSGTFVLDTAANVTVEKPVSTCAVSVVAQLPPAVQVLVDKITAKGEEIRTLKAAKVCIHVYVWTCLCI